MSVYNGLLNRENMPENGVFAFGSNKIGLNGNPRKGTGGAALIAQLEFGVKQGEIMDNRLSDSGKAYGIVTVLAPKKYISESSIQSNISKFYKFASENVDKNFYVAYDGKNPDAISLNGKTRSTLAKLFYQAGSLPSNVIFEKDFYRLILINR